ncbi:MAG: tetratricopeptide repeat protein [Gemmatimonadales bacterium]
MPRKRKNRKRQHPGATPPTDRRSGQRTRRLTLLSSGGLGLAGIAAVAVWWSFFSPIELHVPPAVHSETVVEAADFVGAEACGSCHREQYRKWQTSTHGRAGGVPSPGLVIARFDGVAIRFSDATVVPAVSPDGRYTFTVTEVDRDPVVLTVTGVVGGGHMVGGGTQGFVAAFPDGTVRFLPFDFVKREGVWFCNTNTRANQGWVPITPKMSLLECADWPPMRVLGTTPHYANCQECHGSQISLGFDTTSMRYETRLTSLRINCESCHGPGRRHVRLAQTGQISDSADVGLASLATLSKDESLEVCFRCHALKDVMHSGYLPGQPLQERYSLGLPFLGDSPLFPDGRVRSFAYQGNHRFSACYLDGSMTCTDCHEPHGQGYRDIWGRSLQSRFSDGQCLDCHASKTGRVEQHTHHPTNSAGSRCVSCHMPYFQHPELGNAVRFARSDHTIAIPRPAFDAGLGITGACVQCHGDRSVAELEKQTHEWYGEIKPHRAIVAAQVRSQPFPDIEAAAAELLDTGANHPLAQIVGLGTFVRRYVIPDMPDPPRGVIQSLRSLAESSDLDLRATALAALHLVSGNDRATRRFLARAITAAGARRERLVDRWLMAIATFADLYAVSGDWPSAISSYQKGLEIRPNDGTVLRNMGLAQLSAGAPGDAAESLRKAASADPTDPDSWLNLGVALERLSNPGGAEAAYRRALAIKPDAARAHANLGNILFQGGNPEAAVRSYQEAIRLAPKMVQARVALATALISMGQTARALEVARRAVVVAPESPLVERFLQDLEQALKGSARDDTRPRP